MRGAFLVALALIFAIGSLDAVRGLLAPHIQGSLNFNLSQMGLLLAGAPLGFLLSGLVAGKLLERLGLKKVVFLSGLFVTVAIVGLVILRQIGFLTLAFVFIGFSKGLMEIGLNTYTAGAYPQARARYLGILHGFYGGGSIVFPVVAGWMLMTGVDWRGIYVLLAAVFLLAIPAGFVFRIPADQAQGEEKSSPALGSFLIDKRFYWLASLVVFYVASEVGILSWLPYYLETYKQVDPLHTPYFIGAFFLLFTVGSITGGQLAERWGYEWVLGLTAAAGGLCLVAGLWGTGSWKYLFPFVGLFYSIIFPILVALASRDYPGQSGTVIGYLSTAAGGGAMVSAWLIGILGEWIGFQTAFWLPVWFMGIVVGLAYFGKRVYKQSLMGGKTNELPR
ncbi:sugar MFS transporter [Ammoniphilus sp. CFH 90114]|uniref:MFS transporter n=1 Tax=Ammoniphilus sp. CFH 90114 TaxID=2493665 RepID=UPI00100F62BD|nr:MFS transporter [Ammoniphilus sp. CFH 90114]RXT04299.1 MFS transporter [Ammoniphilus sp. CFH 90114]